MYIVFYIHVPCEIQAVEPDFWCVVCVIMSMPMMAVVLVVKVMVAVVEVLIIVVVWAGMVMGMLSGVEVIVVAAVTIALEFVMPL